MLAQFSGSGLGTACVGVRVYARSLRFVGADSVRRGPLGSGLMCWLCFVGADSVRRGPWGSGFMRSPCFVGADSVRRGPWRYYVGAWQW